MSAARERRVAGLGPPDRAATVPPPADDEHDNAEDDTTTSRKQPAKPRQKRRQPPRRTSRPDSGKHRRAVTVPTGLVEQLRRRAQELDRYQTDLILDCLAATASDLEQAHGREQPRATSPFDRPRRRAHRGRTVTTLTLYLTSGEVDAMDALADRLGLTRSAVVTQALEHGLEHTA